MRDEQRPAILQIGDHRHADDADDKLPPARRACLGLRNRVHSSSHGHVSVLPLARSFEFLHSNFCCLKCETLTLVAKTPRLRWSPPRKGSLMRWPSLPTAECGDVSLLLRSRGPRKK